MVSAKTLYIFGVGASSLLPLLLIRPVLQNRDKPGATGLLLAIPGVSLWSLGLALNMAATTPRQWYLTATLTLLVTELTTIGWFVTAAEYTGVKAPTRRFIGALLVFPLAIQILAWTNSWHNLVYPPLSTVPLGEPIRISMSEHIAIPVHTVGSYLLLLAGFVLLSRNTFSQGGIRRRQGIALTASAIPAMVPNVLYIADVTQFQLTPLGFMGTVFVLAWALFRADFLDVVPVGRNRAVESMEDPVVTLDDGMHVVDSNPAARALVDAKSDWEGTLATEFFRGFPEVVERLDDEDIETEITVTDDDRRRHFVLNVSPIYGLQDERQGTLVVLQEYTELKERERDLDLLRQVQSRVLRHNIRNEMMVLKGNSEVIADDFDDRYGEMAERMVATADDLISVSNKARSVEKLVDRDQTPATFDLTETVRGVVDSYRTAFPAATITLDGPEHCLVHTIPAVEMAIQNLVENGVEHNTSSDPTVAVGIEHDGDEAVLSVTDNGPGIPEYELSVLEQGEETALEHGSGVGLWVIDWVMKNSTIDIDFEYDGTGTAVTLRIPRADGE